jgi:hypothetical protein
MSEKAKTGWFLSASFALFNLFSDFTGQQLCPSKLKTCTISPPDLLLLGCRIYIITDSSSLNETSDQTNVSSLNVVPEWLSSSEIRKEPKNAVVQADQMTSLRESGQSEIAISCPKIFRHPSVMTAFGSFFVALYDARFFAPTNIVLAAKLAQLATRSEIT